MKTQRQYVMESRGENERLERQSRMRAYNYEEELQNLAIQPGDKVLDAGCGTGIVSDYLSRQASEVKVVGWDFSDERVHGAALQYGQSDRIKFMQKDLLNPGAHAHAEAFGDERFDVIVCRYVLRHFSSTNVRKVISNLWEVLKPGGRICCVDVEGVMGEVSPASVFLSNSLKKIREAKSVDFQVARKMPSLLLEKGFEKLEWNAYLSLFQGDELEMEINNLRHAVQNASSFVKKTLGGARNYSRFTHEYFEALKNPGSCLFYNRVVAQGIKPVARPQLIRVRG